MQKEYTIKKTLKNGTIKEYKVMRTLKGTKRPVSPRQQLRNIIEAGLSQEICAKLLIMANEEKEKEKEKEAHSQT
jgi:hypothetical protein